MRARISTIGCDEQYGERRVILDDDQLGELAIREIEFEDFDELTELLDDVDRLNLEPSNWDKYDAEITVICGRL